MRMKFLARIFAFVLVIALFTESAAAAEPVQAKPLVYTALGDSISTGYRLGDTKTSYVSLFGGYLCTTPVNMGQNGLDSAGLLKKITTDETVMEQLRKSDIITVSMGGNDLLPVFSSLAPTSVSTLISAVNTIRSTALQTKFNAAVDKFSQNWAKIIVQLRKLAPHAVIVVTTLINPYQGIVFTIPLIVNFDFGAFSDTYVQKINKVITDNAGGNYQVADSYAVFKQHANEKLTNADLSKFDFDPHPNISGHNLISQAHQAVSIRFTANSFAWSGPSTVKIPSYAASATAQYTARPLFTCFTSDTAAQVVYTVESAGDTDATIDPMTGVLSVRHPGKVQISASVAAPLKNLTATQTFEIRIEKSSAKLAVLRYLLSVLAGLLLLAAVTLLILIRKARSKNR